VLLEGTIVRLVGNNRRIRRKLAPIFVVTATHVRFGRICQLLLVVEAEGLFKSALFLFFCRAAQNYEESLELAIWPPR
jgi:hypothetical protein